MLVSRPYLLYDAQLTIPLERPKSSPASDLVNIDAPPAQSHQFGGNKFQFQRKSFAPINIPNRRGGLRNPATSSSEQHHERLQGLIADVDRKKQARAVAALARGKPSAMTVEMLERDEMAKNLTQQIKRQFKPGDIYAPHDLSWQEQVRWQKKNSPKYDVFDQTNFNPKDHYKVCSHKIVTFEVHEVTGCRTSWYFQNLSHPWDGLCIVRRLGYGQ